MAMLVNTADEGPLSFTFGALQVNRTTWRGFWEVWVGDDVFLAATKTDGGAAPDLALYNRTEYVDDEDMRGDWAMALSRAIIVCGDIYGRGGK